MLSPLTAFYNRLTADVPHCYPADEKEFAHAMRGVTHSVKDSETFDSEAAFVAMKRGTVLGFAHVGIGQTGDNREVEKALFDSWATNAVSDGLDRPCWRKWKPI